MMFICWKRYGRVSKMNETNIFDTVAGKTQSEVKELVLSLYSAMTPERFSEHMNNMQYLARQSGQENEREELVCRLLASGMPVEEISVVLCIRTDAVRIIEQNNATIKIPDYAKKLKDRRRRRQKQSL